MARWGRRWAVLAALCLTVACDPGGRPYEDLRLARLQPGVSSEQEVTALFGPPAAVRTLPDGRGLVYPLGPEGAHTLLLRIGPDGRYQGHEDLLTRANFARVAPGMSGAEVTALLGPPARTQPYALSGQTAWEWRFLDVQETRLFVAMFDADGRVASTAVEDDPRRQGGR